MKTILFTIAMAIWTTFSFAQSKWNKDESAPIKLLTNNVTITMQGFDALDTIYFNSTKWPLTNIYTDSIMTIKMRDTNTFQIKIAGIEQTIKPTESDQFQLKYGNVSTAFLISSIRDSTKKRSPQKTDISLINIYKDALNLKKGYHENIILNYKIDTTFPYYNKINNIQINGANAESDNVNSFLNKLGGIEVTSLADGMSQFLVTRVKKELSLAFFNKFKESIQNDEYLDLKLMFPETKSQLSLIDDRIYDLKPYLYGLRFAAISDLKSLPSNLPDLLNENTQLQKYLIGRDTLHFAVKSGLELTKAIYENKNFGMALEKLDYFNAGLGKENGIYKLKEIIRFFSFALKSNHTDLGYYLDQDSINNLITDSVLLENFKILSLAYIQKGDHQVVKISPTIYSDVETFFKNKSIITLLKGYQKASAIFTQAQEDSNKTEKNNLYFQAAHQILETIKSIMPQNDAIHNYFFMVQQGVFIAKSFYISDYMGAIGSVSGIYAKLNTICPKCNKDLGKLSRTLSKYGIFLGQISQTENADQVEAVINQFAAPVGSYRSKSLNTFTISLDSYVGLGINRVCHTDSSLQFSIFTPIGVSFTLSSGNGKFSYSLMPILFDIGPLVSNRFRSDAESPAKVYLKEVFAPGVMLSIGIHQNCPVFFNIGYQQPAMLTKVASTENTYNLKPKNSLFASINVNIPLLILVNRKN